MFALLAKSHLEKPSGMYKMQATAWASGLRPVPARRVYSAYPDPLADGRGLAVPSHQLGDLGKRCKLS